MGFKNYRDRDIVEPRNWHRLIEMTEEDVKALWDEWGEVEKFNKKFNVDSKAQAASAIGEIEALLGKYGISVKGARGGRLSWFDRNICDQIGLYYRGTGWFQGMPYVHPGASEYKGVRLYCNKSPSTLIEQHSNVLFQWKQGTTKSNAKEERIVSALRRVDRLKIDVDGKTIEEIVAEVNEAVRNQWLAETYPDGTKVDIDCEECSYWIVGERRCSCGNRRFSLEVEGDFFTGYYAYPVAG